MSAPATEESAAAPTGSDMPPAAAGLHRPWRALVALVEVLVAAAAMWAAYRCWPRGIASVTLELEDGSRLESTRYFGNWMGLAILLGTVAALLVLDAVRQVLLAVRARPKARRAHAASR